MVRRREGSRPAAGLARKLGGSSTRGPPTGEDIGGSTNAYSAARLRCRDLLLRRTGLAARQGLGGQRGLDRTERKVIRLVNRIRARHGLRRLRASRPLAARRRHTGDMLRRDFLSHASSDGTPMGDRVRRYTGAELGGREHRRRLRARHRAQGRADVDGLAAAPGRAAVAVGPPDRRRQAARQARERATRGLHGRSRLPRLSGRAGRCRIASPRDELNRPRSTRR